MAGKEKRPKIRLQGHEKFLLREGWLNKGINLVSETSDIFQGKEGPDKFGVGNNMVKAIRYWLKAFTLINDRPGHGAELTELGNIIKENDPYLEEMFTLWVLHSNLVKNVEEATTWFMFFNRCDIEEFSKEEIFKQIYREIFKYAGRDDFSEQSLKNDIDLLLNMYGKEKGFSDPEEKNVSPLAQLGLVKKGEALPGKKGETTYIKSHPDRRSINEWVILYELAVMLEETDNISIDTVSIGEKSIGAIYQLSRVAINEYLDKLDALEFIRVDRTAGLDMIYKIGDLNKEQILRNYYVQYR